MAERVDNKVWMATLKNKEKEGKLHILKNGMEGSGTSHGYGLLNY